MSFNQALSQAIGAATGEAFKAQTQQAEQGGSINRAFRLSDGSRSFFVKTNRAALLPMFEAEAVGLEALRATASIRVPQVIASGQSGGESYLVLEYIELRGRLSGRAFAEALTALHQAPQDRFGFSIDNTIGSTPQHNPWSDDWVDFYRQQRLLFQLDLLAPQGGVRLQERGRLLCEQLGGFFGSYRPQPSLLHGDLWSGNWGAAAQGEAVIFDPACYVGDRESDLAMTELFGRPDADFYAVCDALWPIDPGYSVRKELYNLYHILNHANLFGGGYAAQAEQTVDSLLSHLHA